MQIITLDFETMFSDDYTLKKMSTEAYIRDPRFEVHGCAVKFWNDRPPQWLDGLTRENMQGLAEWHNCGLLCHHAHFDGLILSHHYGIVPKAYLCSLSMARLLLGNHVSVSLDSVREHFQMPAKSTPYNLFRGKHWNELTNETQQQIAQGACNEVESIFEIFIRFMRGDY